VVRCPDPGLESASVCRDHLQPEDRSLAGLLAPTLRVFQGVPRKMIIDQTKGVITKARYYDPVPQRSYTEAAEAYGSIGIYGRAPP